MGTNYYAIKKIDDELQEKLIAPVKARDVEGIRDILPDRVHIGKKSHGWKFFFNHNDWKYFPESREYLNAFLSQCNILDEYGSNISLEEFWDIATHKEGEIDNKEYFTNWDKYNVDSFSGEALPKPNLHYGDLEEYHDGLLFSTSTDFF